VSSSHEKIFQIDAHIAASSSGLVADARRLVDIARLEAQKHRLSYDEEIPVDLLSKMLGDHIQYYTQFAGVRPYGVSLLLAGTDGGVHLFETDPSGALFEYKACAIGSGKKVVEEILKKEYNENITVNDGLKLVLKALRKASEEKLTPDKVDIAIIRSDDKLVKMLNKKEIEKALAEK
jgi:proteasome alpha subunit